MPRPFRPHRITPHTTEDAVSVCFTMPNGRYFNHTFTGLEVVSVGGMSVVEEWATDVDAQIQRGVRATPARFSFAEGTGGAGASALTPPTRETDDEASERMAAYSQETRARLVGQAMPTRQPAAPSTGLEPYQESLLRDLIYRDNAMLRRVESQITASEVAMRERMSREMFSTGILSGMTVVTSTEVTSNQAFTIDTSAYLAWQPLHERHPQHFITDEVHVPTPTIEASPNEGTEPTVEPTHYLGMPVVRTPNVRPGAVTLQPTGLGRTRTLYIHPTTPTDVWQVEARRQVARLVQRSVPVSIKQTCRYCGKAYPAKQGLTAADPYCSDKCRHAAADLIDCPVCSGTGGVPDSKCGECYGGTYKPCDACQEDHARASLMFTNPSTGSVYYVCPSCVKDEREAGGVQAPQASV